MLVSTLSTMAAPGDTYRVTGEQVNLRAGPSEDANVRSRVKAGDELIELRREGSWLGVRVTSSGEEGWIYEDLVERVSPSTLQGGTAAGPLKELSGTFDILLSRVSDYLGYSVVEKVERVEPNTLRVTPTREWLRNGGSDGHVMAAMAFYQMWKNHQNGRPVSLVMLDDRGKDYVIITDKETGPALSINKPER
jgi:uncharacterized protein YgiM (DUF1202 family)